MNWTERIGSTGAESMIGFLSTHFKVRRPKLRTGYRGNHGHYYPRRKEILTGRDCQPWVVAHEFAHYLFHINNIPPKPKKKLGYNSYYDQYDKWYKANRGSGLKEEWHSQGFYNILKLVIAAIGDTNYPWNLEYKQVFRWAKKDGTFLLTEPGPRLIIPASEFSDGDNTNANHQSC